MLPTIPLDIPAWLYYLCVGGAVLIVGISKAGFGGGVGILAVPVMALVMGPTHMLGIMLPLLIACDLFSNLHYLREYDWRRLRWMLPGAAAGVGLGTIILWGLRGMPPADFNRALTGIVGITCLGIVLIQVYRLLGYEIPALPSHPATPTTAGFIAGAVSTLNHGAAPIMTVYLLQEKLEKRRFVGTILLFFLLVNSAKLPTYLLLPMADGTPLINAATLRDSIWFIPLVPLGTLIGAWLNRRVSPKPFAAILYIAAAVTAAHMVYKSMIADSPAH